jgi:hypothetical protein
LKSVSIKNLHTERYLCDRRQVIKLLKNKVKNVSCKDLEEIYDYSYSFGEEYGRDSGQFNATLKIIINLTLMTKLTTDDINKITNPDKHEKISEHIIKIKKCFNENKQSLTNNNLNL